MNPSRQVSALESISRERAAGPFREIPPEEFPFFWKMCCCPCNYWFSELSFSFSFRFNLNRNVQKWLGQIEQLRRLAHRPDWNQSRLLHAGRHIFMITCRQIKCALSRSAQKLAHFDWFQHIPLLWSTVSLAMASQQKNELNVKERCAQYKRDEMKWNSNENDLSFCHFVKGWHPVRDSRGETNWWMDQVLIKVT